MPQTPCFQECISCAGALRCCCSVLEKSQLVGVIAEEGYESAWFSWKTRRMPTPEVMNFFFYILICLANLHPGVWKELAEEQFFLNVVL